MTTHFCSHTTDGTICDQCIGTTKVPEPWERRYANLGGITRPEMRNVYLAAQVEAWAKEVKALFHALQEHGGDLSMNEYWENQARRLLENWPVKE